MLFRSLSLAYWDMPFYFMAMVVMTEKWIKKRLAEESATAGATPAGQSPAQAGVGRLQATSS